MISLTKIRHSLEGNNMYKPLADSTLMNMTKKEIIEHLRVAEHNYNVVEETLNQQAKNFIILEEKARADEREKFASMIDDVDVDSTYLYIKIDKEKINMPFFKYKADGKEWVINTLLNVSD